MLRFTDFIIGIGIVMWLIYALYETTMLVYNVYGIWWGIGAIVLDLCAIYSIYKLTE